MALRLSGRNLRKLVLIVSAPLAVVFLLLAHLPASFAQRSKIVVNQAKVLSKKLQDRKVLKLLASIPQGMSQTDLIAAYTLRGWSHYHLKNFDAAMADAARALSVKPTVDGYMLRAHCFMMAAKYEQLAEDASEIIKREPDNFTGHSLMMTATRELGRLARQEVELNEMVRISPTEWPLDVRREFMNAAGRYREALKDADARVKLTPRDTYAYFQRAHIHMALKDTEKALADCRSLQKIDPKHLENLLLMSNIYLLAGKFDEALLYCQKAMGFYPRNARVFALRGTILHTSGDKAGALREYSRSLEIEPSMQIYSLRESLHMHFRKPRLALQDAQSMIRMEPLNSIGYAAAWEASKETGYRHDEYMEKAIRLLPTNFNFVFALAHQRVQDIKKALPEVDEALLKTTVADLNRVADMNPKLIDTYLSLCELYACVNMRERARNALERALKVDLTANEFVRIGDAAMCREFSGTAVAAYSKALEKSPAVDVYKKRGDALSRQLLLREAIEDYSRCVETPSLAVDALLSRGKLYYELLQPQLALDDFTMAVQRARGSTRPYIDRGVTLALMGCNDGAVRDFSKALSIDPLCLDALMGRAGVYMQMSNFELALSDVSKLIAAGRTNERIYYNRALLFNELGHYREAVEDLNRVVAMKTPPPSYALKSRADSFAKLKQFERAIEDLETIRSRYPWQTSVSLQIDRLRKCLRGSEERIETPLKETNKR